MRLPGRFRFGWCDDHRCCPGHRNKRKRKRIESRYVKVLIIDEIRQPAFFDDHDLAVIGSYCDTSDCTHGCNGDCVMSGNDRCNFTCHLDSVHSTREVLGKNS